MIQVGQKVKFDPFQHIGGYGASDLRGKRVTGTVVEVHEKHGWFSVEYGKPAARTSFVFDDIGKDVKILK